MIGLETYLNHLAKNNRKTLNDYQEFQIWMEGRGFYRDVGGVHMSSTIMRSIQKHARGRDGKQAIIVVGGAAGDPSTIVRLRAIVSEFTESGGSKSNKPVHGIAWLTRHIILARHVRLVMSVRAARQYRRDKANSPEIEEEVRDMLAEL